MQKKISIDNLKYNFKQIRSFLSPNSKIMAVVKSNAYGHGIKNIAPCLEKLGVNFFGVSTPKEAFELQSLKSTGNILILEPVLPEEYKLFLDKNILITISSIEEALALISITTKYKKHINVHIKVDTGMSRCGAFPLEVKPILEIFKKSSFSRVLGIFSHLASSNRNDLASFKAQNELFLNTVTNCKKSGNSFEEIHLSNTFGALHYPQSHYTMVRIGGALYGALPFPPNLSPIDLKPVMSLSAKIVQIKTVPPNTGVGYDHRYITTKQTKIAIINAGYARGIPYQRSLAGKVLINGEKRPIIGAVSMGLSIIELQNQDIVNVGDEVVIMGRQGKNSVTVYDIAKTTASLPYDILCKVGQQT
ncbi:alanine racemase [PVC group bacterium (ex Bugula neritina AB1)]|nr:alanine racemase [PVC group bacterium (ex Bugula neritina AB1)]